MTINFIAHSDVDALTIISPLNETKCIQMRKDVKLVPVTPLQDAFSDTLSHIGGREKMVLLYNV